MMSCVVEIIKRLKKVYQVLKGLPSFKRFTRLKKVYQVLKGLPGFKGFTLVEKGINRDDFLIEFI